MQIAFPTMLAGETIKLSENVRGGFWAPTDSYEKSPSQQGERGTALPADADYSPNHMRVWQAWIPASNQAENGPFILTVDYSETLLSSNEDRSNFTFYKQKISKGKKEVEHNNNEGRGISTPTRFEITVPMSPEE